jgi:metal-responsive CopG/Arc/MetJ family transcriptional regulator
MKTAISLPDELFNEAEKYAKKRGISRSELYADALRDYLKQRDGAWITESINKVLEETTNDLDPALVRAQIRAVGKEEW